MGKREMDFEAAKVLCRSFAGCTEDIKWGAAAGVA